MITQTKLFKQASKVLNANNTLEQITKEGLVKYKSNPSNKKITFNLNQSPIKAQRRVSSTKIDNQLNITLNMNISNDANNSQNVFINLNSTNGNAFKKLKGNNKKHICTIKNAIIISNNTRFQLI